MPTYSTLLPVVCFAKVTLESDEPIPDDEIKERLLSEGEVGTLCWHCATKFEMDGIIDEESHTVKNLDFDVEVETED